MNYVCGLKSVHSTLRVILDLTTVMATLTSTCRQDQCVSHALKVRSAWALCNYHRFFHLYRDAPKMSAYIMDWFIERERKLALRVVVKSYVLLVSLSCCLFTDVYFYRLLIQLVFIHDIL